MTEYKTQAGGHSTTATTWQDLSGNENNGTLQGGTWLTNGLLLDGTDDGVKINSQDLTTMTVEMTYTPKIVKSQEEVLLANYESGGYGIAISNGSTYMQVYISNTYQRAKSTDIINTNKVYYIAGTFDGTTIKLYVNGVLEASTTVTETIGQPVSNTILAIGANPSGSNLTGGYANGIVHTARLYDRASTAEEIMNNYLIDKEKYNI